MWLFLWQSDGLSNTFHILLIDERIGRRIELCARPADAGRRWIGRHYIVYDGDAYHSTFVQMISGQIPVLEQQFTISEGAINTSFLIAELEFNDYLYFYYHFVLYEEPDRAPGLIQKLRN